MNRKAAQTTARGETLTFGDLRNLIRPYLADCHQASKVNPAFTLSGAAGIYDAAIADRPDDEVPKAWRRDVYRDRDLPSKDFLIVVNILRDCG